MYCALTGMLLHYTTLTSFFWLALTSAVMHRLNSGFFNSFFPSYQWHNSIFFYSKVTGPEALQEEMENVYGEIANRVSY